MEAHWLKDIKTDFGGRVVLTRETEVFKQVRNEKRKEKLVGSDEIGKCGYGCYWRSWLCDKKVEKWSKKLQVDANIGVVEKNYLAGNSAHRKESFRTIRERSNLLALGHLLWPAQ